jgi:DNA-binding NarL/FixJ family response regulator
MARLRRSLLKLARRIGLRELRRGRGRPRTIVSVVPWHSAQWPRELRIAIATDDQSRQSSLRRAFVHRSSTADRALAADDLHQLPALGPDAVVIDWPCRFADHVELTQELSRLPGAPAVVVVGADGCDLRLAMAQLSAGAGALLPRDVTGRQLRDAVECVLRGEAVVPPEVAAHVVRTAQDADRE